MSTAFTMSVGFTAFTVSVAFTAFTAFTTFTVSAGSRRVSVSGSCRGFGCPWFAGRRVERGFWWELPLFRAGRVVGPLARGARPEGTVFLGAQAFGYLSGSRSPDTAGRIG
ncbi:hypothetical protein [Frankia nepalensis]|uniref:Uncharacterized protein n=1 Tax=Frankia nepalensis TaxID=1836974 RepID=A0A937UQ62_9ACTN|nr:hypothetical protein [Frankia nepalensis]MBL7499402.1 hypothetical protein [Frankia nepalensis]MBL7509943.1 hypothetical protein [Frankia nepalensis]MBL7629773.1 hypothetical protein [Frankia nepalensis]